MSTEHLPVKTLIAGIVSITVMGFGCADDGTETNDESIGSPQTPAGGSATPTSGATAATPSGAGQDATSGAMPGGGVSQPPGAVAPGGGTPATGDPAGADVGGAGNPGAGAPGADTESPGVTTAGTEGPDMEGPGAGGAGTEGADMESSGTGGASMESAGTGGAGTEEPEVGGAPGMMDEPEPEPDPEFTGTCTESQDTGRNASGSGPHDVVIETNSEDGIKCGTIFRPADMGGDEKYPIFVWGEGGCSQNGLSNQAAMAEIASWGYFIVADGTPGGDNSCQGGQSGEAFLDYITWAIAENDKPCSTYYKSLDTEKIAADGFSCGGLMSENVADDPRFTAIGITSSGLMGPNNNLWDAMHAPFKIMNGGSSDVAYENGLNDYDAISSRGIPILYFSKTSAGHGGDLGQGRGDFNLVNLAWLNWQLKGDEGDTGKAFLIGPTCEFCDDPGWDFKSANIE